MSFRLRYAIRHPDERNPTVTPDDAASCVRPGWRPIVIKLIEDLKEVGWDGSLLQVKEKFGGLRFYADGIPDAGVALIDEAEDASFNTCEDCGVSGDMVRTKGPGWIMTLCEECRNRTEV